MKELKTSELQLSAGVPFLAYPLIVVVIGELTESDNTESDNSGSSGGGNGGGGGGGW